MHNKYSKDGLAVVSVNVDDPKDKDTRDIVIGFLKKKRATFTNLVMDPKQAPDKLAGKFKVAGYPTTLVYDREGKLVEKFEGARFRAISRGHTEIDELVEKLLNK